MKKIIIFLITLLLFFIFYKVKERFIDICLGKRDGVSGCRDCCRKFKNMYDICVSKCMKF